MDSICFILINLMTYNNTLFLLNSLNLCIIFVSCEMYMKVYFDILDIKYYIWYIDLKIREEW